MLYVLCKEINPPPFHVINPILMEVLFKANNPLYYNTKLIS